MCDKNLVLYFVNDNNNKLMIDEFRTCYDIGQYLNLSRFTVENILKNKASKKKYGHILIEKKNKNKYVKKKEIKNKNENIIENEKIIEKEKINEKISEREKIKLMISNLINALNELE